MATFHPQGMNWIGETTERSLATHDGIGRLDIDLSETRFVTPYILALIPVLVDTAISLELPVVFTPPSGDVARYASRMHLGRFLDGRGIHHDLPQVREHNQADRLCELREFNTADDTACERLAILMSERCTESGLPAPLADDVSAQVYEICNNASAHAASPSAFLCAQTYKTARRQRLEFVVADAGRGIRASLEGTEFERGSDGEAICTAVERRTSSLGRPDHFGIGLDTLRTFASEHGGTLAIRSGSAHVRFRLVADDSVTDVSELPGTIVSCSIVF